MSEALNVGVHGVLTNRAGRMPLQIVLHHDGLSVAMTLIGSFAMPCGGVLQDSSTWEFARDLLDEACSKPDEQVGQGDVRACYTTGNDALVIDGVMLGEDVMRLTLNDVRRNTSDVLIPADVVKSFLAASFALDPSGSERIDVDEAIAKILGGPQ